MKMRWLLTWKTTTEGGQAAKARLVVLGFRHAELTSLKTAAPTLSKLGRNTIMATAALHGFDMIVGDISSAFL